jgi:hypothetical protein
VIVTTRLLEDADGRWPCLSADGDGGIEAYHPRTILLRTVEEDPFGRDHLALLAPARSWQANLIDRAWSDAQLAADATMLGGVVGLRVALVNEGARWFGDLVIARTRRRLRLAEGSPSPVIALRTIRELLVASIMDRPVAPVDGGRGRPRVVDQAPSDGA